MDQGGVEFELEKNWVLAHVAAMRVRRDAAIAKKLADEAEWAAGGGVECGCCFDECLPVSTSTSVVTLLTFRATCTNVETAIFSAKTAVSVTLKQSSVMKSL